MSAGANKRIALAALAAPIFAGIAVGLASPAWAASEKVEPSEPSEPSEVSEANLPTMPSEQQEQSPASMNISLDKPASYDNPCTAVRYNEPIGGTDPAQVPELHQYNNAFC